MTAANADASIHAELARLSAAVAAQDEAILTALCLAAGSQDNGAAQLEALATAAQAGSTPSLLQTHAPDPHLVNGHLQRLYTQAAQRRRVQDRADVLTQLRHQPNETQ